MDEVLKFIYTDNFRYTDGKSGEIKVLDASRKKAELAAAALASNAEALEVYRESAQARDIAAETARSAKEKAALDEMRLTAEAAAMRQEDPAGELYPAGWYVLLRTGLCERGE
jgi:hypothetical protein